MERSRLTDDIWEKIEAGDYNIPNLGAYFSCTHRVLGFQTKAGALLLGPIKKYLTERNISPAMQHHIQQRCFINQRTPEMTSLKFEQCIRGLLRDVSKHNYY